MSELTYEQQKELITFEFDCKMKSLEYIRATESLKHEWRKEESRIYNAEMRKREERRANRNFIEKFKHKG